LSGSGESGKALYYKPSGKVSPLFFLYVLFVVAVAVPVVGVFYVYLVYYLPIVYLSVLATIGCGIVMGLLMGVAAGLGKARNPALVLVSTIAVMCIAKYVQWAVYIPLVFYAPYNVFGITLGERFLTSFYLLAEPGTVVELAGVINAVGAWSLGHGGPAVNGVSLLAVWIMEFAAMTAAACIVAVEKPKFPFCEKTKKWYATAPEKAETDMPENLDGIKTEIENGEYGGLVRLAKGGNANAAPSLALLFYKPPSPERLYYLQIKRLKTGGGKKRDGKPPAKYIAIDGQSVREIMERPNTTE